MSISQDKRKIQKLNLRIRHLDEELEQARELFEDYKTEFKSMSQRLKAYCGIEEDTPELEVKSDNTPPSKSCNINPDQQPNDQSRPEDTNSNSDSDEEFRHEIDNQTSSAPAWMRKTYKQIALKTHPDRISQNKSLSPYQVAEYRRMFSIAKNAIEKHNGGDLVYVAEQLGLEPDIPYSERISLLYKRAESIKNDIFKIYKTPAWLWGESYANRSVQKKILQSYCGVLKISIPEEKSFDDFLDSLSEE